MEGEEEEEKSRPVEAKGLVASLLLNDGSPPDCLSVVLHQKRKKERKNRKKKRWPLMGKGYKKVCLDVRHSMARLAQCHSPR